MRQSELAAVQDLKNSFISSHRAPNQIATRSGLPVAALAETTILATPPWKSVWPAPENKNRSGL